MQSSGARGLRRGVAPLGDAGLCDAHPAQLLGALAQQRPGPRGRGRRTAEVMSPTGQPWPPGSQLVAVQIGPAQTPSGSGPLRALSFEPFTFFY